MPLRTRSHRSQWHRASTKREPPTFQLVSIEVKGPSQYIYIFCEIWGPSTSLLVNKFDSCFLTIIYYNDIIDIFAASKARREVMQFVAFKLNHIEHLNIFCIMISLKYWDGMLLNIENYMVYEGPPDFPWLWASRKQDMALPQRH